jgi:hypothetical protein
MMSQSDIPQDPREMHAPPPECKHCQQPMTKMVVPPMSNFESPWMYVCFNDECGYFQRGWDYMESNFGSKTSYRFKTDPFTGETGPIPVWSADALREGIVEEDGQ